VPFSSCFFIQASACTWFNLRNAPGNYLQKLIAPGQPADLFGGKELDRNRTNFVDIFIPVGACPV